MSKTRVYPNRATAICSKNLTHLSDDVTFNGSSPGTWIGGKRTIWVNEPGSWVPHWCIVVCMRTNIDLDDELVAEAQRLTGIETKKAVVHEALQFLVGAKKRKSLLDLRGKIEFATGYDYKALRERRR